MNYLLQICISIALGGGGGGVILPVTSEQLMFIITILFYLDLAHNLFL
jgi:hypothetical protein